MTGSAEMPDAYRSHLLRVMAFEDEKLFLPDALSEGRSLLDNLTEAEVRAVVAATLEELLSREAIYLVETEWVDGFPEKRRLGLQEAKGQIEATWWREIPPAPATPLLVKLTERGQAIAETD